MDKNNNRKLIGTIVGVVFFALLIVGATFAWLTFSANVNNGRYNSGTLNFTISYSGSADINYLPMYYGDVAVTQFVNDNINPTAEIDAYTLSLPGTLYLKLHVNDNNDSNALAAAGCIRYAVCSNSADRCGGQGKTLSNFADSYGIVEASLLDSNNDIIIYEGPLVAEDHDSGEEAYWIYLWIDNELITSSEGGLNFTGYIYGYAEQSQ